MKTRLPRNNFSLNHTCPSEVNSSTILMNSIGFTLTSLKDGPFYSIYKNNSVCKTSNILFPITSCHYGRYFTEI